MSTRHERALDLIDDARELLLEAQQVLGGFDDCLDEDVALYRSIERARDDLKRLFEPPLNAPKQEPMGLRASVAAIGKPPSS